MSPLTYFRNYIYLPRTRSETRKSRSHHCRSSSSSSTFISMPQERFPKPIHHARRQPASLGPYDHITEDCRSHGKSSFYTDHRYGNIGESPEFGENRPYLPRRGEKYIYPLNSEHLRIPVHVYPSEYYSSSRHSRTQAGKIQGRREGAVGAGREFMVVIPVWASVEDVRAGLCGAMEGRDGREELEVWVHIMGGGVVDLGDFGDVRELAEAEGLVVLPNPGRYMHVGRGERRERFGF